MWNQILRNWVFYDHKNGHFHDVECNQKKIRRKLIGENCMKQQPISELQTDILSLIHSQIFTLNTCRSV